MSAFAKVGLLNNDRRITLDSWRSLVSKTLGLNPKFDGGISSVLDVDEVTIFHEALQYLGLSKSPFENASSSMPPLPAGPHTPLDLFAYLLSHKLKYQPGEQDMVVLSHEIKTKDKRGEEVHTSTLISYGTQVADMFFKGERPASAMARTVGYPVAIAALLVVDEAISLRGVHGPLRREIYEPVLEGLEEVGIRMVENTRRVGHGVQTVEGALVRTGSNRVGKQMPLVMIPLHHNPLDAPEPNFED